MTCLTCHSRCGDCSEGGITLKRQLRSPALGIKPTARTVTAPVQKLVFAEHQVKVQQAQKAQK